VGDKLQLMAADFELTDAMRNVIGKESDPYPVEFTTTGIRAFARGVGYTDPVYYDIDTAKAAGYTSLPAPPSYLGVPIFNPSAVEANGQPKQGSAPKLEHGLPNILDGGTEVTYVRVPVAGETLTFTNKVAALDVKESKGLGKMLVVTMESNYRDASNATVFTVNAQAIWY
jgi:acyl dehydratase